MGIINRFLCFIYSVVVGVLSLVAAAACLGIIPEHFWGPGLREALARPETLGVVLGILAFSIYFVCYSLFVGGGKSKGRKVSKEFLVVRGTNGNVQVSVEAVQGLAERIARSVQSVRDVKAEAVAVGDDDNATLEVDMRLVVLHGANVADVSNLVSTGVQREILGTLGLPDVPVRITVADISNAPVETNKRVI